MKFQLIDKAKNEFPVHRLCGVLGVAARQDARKARELASQKRRALLAARKILQEKALAIENDIRGLLRNCQRRNSPGQPKTKISGPSLAA